MLRNVHKFVNGVDSDNGKNDRQVDSIYLSKYRQTRNSCSRKIEFSLGHGVCETFES